MKPLAYKEIGMYTNTKGCMEPNPAVRGGYSENTQVLILVQADAKRTQYNLFCYNSRKVNGSMKRDPTQVTACSQTLRQTAIQLVECCPVQFGEEIVLFGSAGWGVADECSDIDLDFWVQQIPPFESVKDWLIDCGVKLFHFETEVSPEEGMHLIGRYRDIWVEFTWFTIAWRTKVISNILAGEELERSKLAHAWNVTTGMPLRTRALVPEWQQRLAEYPDALQSRLISASTEFWLYPHHIEVLWTLAFRHELMGLDEWLLADLQDGLRILFALNRQWEPDWKNLTAASELLRQKPSLLIERVNSILLSPKPVERVELLLRLLADILSLVPEPFDVSVAKKNVEASLLDHCT